MWSWPKRFWVIIYTVYVYGLLDVVQIHVRPLWLRKLIRLLPSSRKYRKLAPAVRLRLALESLGPIFVKFGQVLSTRQICYQQITHVNWLCYRTVFRRLVVILPLR